MKIIFIFILFCSILWAENEKVSIQLDWKYQFQYAGFIAAKEKGFYAEAGLDVELREYQDGIDIVNDVLKQRANYGVYNSSIVIDNGQIRPIVLMATYLQESPLIFIAQKGITNPFEFEGKTIMWTTDELKYSSLALLLSHFNISTKNATYVNHTFGIEEFAQKKVDVMSAFLSNQLILLDQHHIPYEVINPKDYGFVMSAVNVFTSPTEALAYTERTRRFIDATNRGWKYAFDHKNEIIDLLIKHYKVKKSRAALKYEAKIIEKLMYKEFYPIGDVNSELTVRAFKQLKRGGLLQENQDLGKFMFSEIEEKKKKNSYFTEVEQAYLLTKKKITMCVDPEWYPFEVIHEKKHIGISADVMKIFEHKLGIPIELVQAKTWDESLVLAQNRECDIFSLAASTPSRLEYMDFTSAYVTLPIVLVTDMNKPFTDDISSLKGKKVAGVKGYAITEQLKANYPNVNVIEVTSIKEGLKMIDKGEIYGYVDNLMVSSSYIQKEYTGILKVSSRLKEQIALAVGTRNDEPMLHAIFEKLVNNLDNTVMQPIYNRWVATVEEVNWLDNRETFNIFSILLLLIIGFSWRYMVIKRYNKQLLTLSITDKLTGLYNRQKTDQKLIEEQKKINRYADYHCSVMMIDIDYFKRINDNYGHQKGDDILIQLSGLLKQNLRDIDIIGRWGGEEFMVILPNTILDETKIVAENLRKRVQDHLFEFSTPVPITVSIGIGEFVQNESVNECVKKVDEALYRAKEKGRNRVCSSII